MDVSNGLAIGLRILGILLILFAIVDVVLGRVFEIDITGVTWSPIAAGLAGGALLRVFGSSDE